ncbi:hypothetical protein EXIGLDRAFT_435021 [Exidia glandulosa HHB12029]|uniref:Uncharacterized protein n=1 Tax=Exidia glandulosa HHB12029 TaxID=1314781 RepID=A0A165KFQ5_EXIGL|nr:hypothetical protein EXIGLDRAFT_435021 [Exidia glandulosa HHB12029]
MHTKRRVMEKMRAKVRPLQDPKAELEQIMNHQKSAEKKTQTAMEAKNKETSKKWGEAEELEREMKMPQDGGEDMQDATKLHAYGHGSTTVMRRRVRLLLSSRLSWTLKLVNSRCTGTRLGGSMYIRLSQYARSRW